MGVTEDVPQPKEEARPFAGLDEGKLLLQPCKDVLRQFADDRPVLLLRQVIGGFSQERVRTEGRSSGAPGSLARVVVGELVAEVTREVEAAAALGDAGSVFDRLGQA